MSAVASLRETIVADLAERDGLAVAFSGGVDSSVVAALAHEALGEDALAVTARSETLPAAELETAERVAREIGIRHETVAFSELADEHFVENDDRRCYVCRTMRLDELAAVASEHGIETVADGTNASDTAGGHRPGLQAVAEKGIVSPLRDHGVDKEGVRELAREYGLSVSEKPSMACLFSRIPTGQRVTDERLSNIERAERFLRERGFRQFRVRDHDGLARIEVGADELDRALDPAFAEAAREHVLAAGFEHVTLDLEGYRTGSVSPDE